MQDALRGMDGLFVALHLAADHAASDRIGRIALDFDDALAVGFNEQAAGGRAVIWADCFAEGHGIHPESGEGSVAVGGRGVMRRSPGKARHDRRARVIRRNRLVGRQAGYFEGLSGGSCPICCTRSMSGCWLTVRKPLCGRSRSTTSVMTAPRTIIRMAAVRGLRRRVSPAL